MRWGKWLVVYMDWGKNYAITDVEGQINRKGVRSRQFPFPGMESDMNLTPDGRKSLSIAARTKIMFYREWMPLGTRGRGRTNGIYLLTNYMYVLTDKFCMEVMIIRQEPRNFMY